MANAIYAGTRLVEGINSGSVPLIKICKGSNVVWEWRGGNRLRSSVEIISYTSAAGDVHPVTFVAIYGDALSESDTLGVIHLIKELRSEGGAAFAESDSRGVPRIWQILRLCADAENTSDGAGGLTLLQALSIEAFTKTDSYARALCRDHTAVVGESEARSLSYTEAYAMAWKLLRMQSAVSSIFHVSTPSLKELQSRSAVSKTSSISYAKSIARSFVKSIASGLIESHSYGTQVLSTPEALIAFASAKTESHGSGVLSVPEMMFFQSDTVFASYGDSNMRIIAVAQAESDAESVSYGRGEFVTRSPTTIHGVGESYSYAAGTAEAVVQWLDPVQTGSNLYIPMVYSATQDGSNLKIK